MFNLNEKKFHPIILFRNKNEFTRFLYPTNEHGWLLTFSQTYTIFLFTPELDYALLCHIILLKKQIFEIRFVCKQLGKHKQIIIVLM